MTSSGALVPRPRKENEELVLRLLHRHGPMTRARLIALSGLSRTTLYDSVTALVDDGTLTVTVPEMARRKRGRPVERLALNPVAGAIGIDFAQHSIRVATANVAYKITGMATRPHDLKAPWKERVEMAYHLAGTLTDGTMPPGAIGIGVSGPMAGPAGSWDDGNHGTVSMLVRERFGIPARLDNNARLAAFAEATWGAAVSERDVLYVQLSHTVSGGLVLGGTLHRGVGGLAGEFGHISLDPVGLSCGCGARGCLETTASIGAVLRSYRTAGGAAENLTQLATALRAGDRRARGVLAEAGAQVGRALAAASNIIGPGVSSRAFGRGSDCVRRNSVTRVPPWAPSRCPSTGFRGPPPRWRCSRRPRPGPRRREGVRTGRGRQRRPATYRPASSRHDRPVGRTGTSLSTCVFDRATPTVQALYEVTPPTAAERRIRSFRR
jgi:predicted NBD/HSP70 family sugar kinase